MGAVVDILLVREDGIDIIRHRYPRANVLKLSTSGRGLEKYRIVIPDEQDEAYYFFLCDNGMATSSRNFLNRIISDGLFKGIAKSRMARPVEAMDLRAEALEMAGTETD